MVKKISFETIEPLNMNASRLIEAFTQRGEKFSRHTDQLLPGNTRGIDMLEATEEIPHYFYLGDDSVSQVGKEFSLRISVELENPASGTVMNWSVWDGKAWKEIAPALDETSGLEQSGDILFSHLPDLEKNRVGEVKSFWLRLGLKGYRGSPLPEIRSMKKTLELKKDSGVIPENGFFSNEDIPYRPVRFEGLFLPFSKEPGPNTMLYIGSDALSRTGSHIDIDIRLSPTYKPSDIDELKDLTIRWEYYSQSGEWKPLGTGSPKGTLDSYGSFIDRTEAFTHSGKVSFIIPEDMIPLAINGIERRWVRLTITEGSYKTEKEFNPPVCQRILIRYSEKPDLFNQYLAYDNFIYRPLNDEIQAGRIFSPFIKVPDKEDDFYVGFNSPFSNNLHVIYFQLSEESDTRCNVAWEYYTEEGWLPLNLVADGTRHLTRRGIIKFIGPVDWKSSDLFGRTAYWLRIRYHDFCESIPHLLKAIPS